MPSFKGLVRVVDGDFSYEGVAAQMNDLQMELRLESEKGSLVNSKMELSKLEFRLADNPFSARMDIANFESPEWTLQAKGSLDLYSLSQLIPSFYPLNGQLETNFTSSGNMKALEAGQYGSLPVNGDLALTNFQLITEEFPQGLSISQLNADFSTDRIAITQFQGKAGSSSFQVTGSLEDFVPYALSNETLKGELNITADQLIYSEWMPEASTEQEENSSVDSTNQVMEVVRIPRNISFKMAAALGQLDYDGLILNDVQGEMEMIDGQLLISRSGFKAVEGSFSAKGSYDSRPEEPLFNMDLKVESVSIPKSFDQFTAVQKFAPVAKNMTGNVGFDFSLSGIIGEDMMPDYTSLSGAGLIQVIKAGFERSEITQGLSSTLKVAKIENPVIDNVRMRADVLDGRLFIKPFDTRLGNYSTTIGGSTGIDGSIDYTLLITVPAKGITQQVNNLAKQFLGNQLIRGSDYVFDVSMTGNYAKPVFKLESVMTKDGVSTGDLVTKKIEEEIQAKKAELEAVAKEEMKKAEDSLNTLVNQKITQGEAQLDSLIENKTDSLTNELLEKLGGKAAKDSTVSEVKQKAKDVLKGLLKRKNKKKNDTIKN